MASSLRPDIIIRQVFRAAQAIVPAANNPAVLVGLNRQLVYRAYAGTFQTNAEYTSYSFPGLVEGAKVEPNTSAVDAVIRPKVYLSTSYGVADVTDDATFNLASTPPTFDLSPTTSAIFETVSGTSGNYSAITGNFTDASADFVTDQVGATDTIYANGRLSFTVTSVVDDTTLSVAKTDRGPDDSKVSISAATGLYRTVTYTGDAGTVYDGFVTEGVRVGDIVTVRGWDGRQNYGDTLKFGAADSSGVRLLEFSTNVTVKVGDLVYLTNDAGASFPAFMILQNVTGAASAIATAVSPAITNESVAGYSGKQQRAYELYKDGIKTSRNSNTAVTITGAAGSRKVAGTFTSPAQDDLVLCSDKMVKVTATVSTTDDSVTGVAGNFSSFAAGDKVIILSGALFVDRVYASITSVTTDGSKIVVDTNLTDATSGPVVVMSIKAKIPFKVTSAADIANLSVVDFAGNGVPTYVSSSGMPATALLIDGVTAAASAATAGFTPDGSNWTMVLASTPSPALAADDLVFSQTGILMFKVLSGSGDTYTVQQDTKAGLTFSSAFSLPVFTAKPTPAELIVTKVAGETSLVVKDVAGIMTSSATAYEGLRTTVEVADALEDIAYTVRKVATSLTADVLVSYAAVRNDHATELIEVNSTTIESVLGPAVPHNPLAFAAAAALANTSVPVYCAQVTADTATGWSNAINLIKTSQVYSIAPLTQNETYLGMFRAHVDLESQPENKRERILFQSHKQESQITRFTWAPSSLETAKFTCASTSSTPTISFDADKSLAALGVIPGDLLSFEYFGQIADKGFVSGSVVDMRVVSVSTSGDSTLTLLRRASDPITLASGVTVTSVTIKSKALSSTQIRDAIAKYPATIKNRRFRNVYPDRCLVTFSDVTNANDTSVGLYGGGSVTGYEVGGWYPAAILAAMRSNIPASATLTKRPFVGIQRLVQGGGTAETDLDKILDGGNTVLIQPSGDNGGVEAVRAISTDVTTLSYVEESVTVQIDNLARRLRAQISPIIGSTVLDKAFFDLFSLLSGAIIQNIVNNREMREIVLVSLSEDPSRADTFLVSYQVKPYYTAAHADITIYI